MRVDGYVSGPLYLDKKNHKPAPKMSQKLAIKDEKASQIKATPVLALENSKRERQNWWQRRAREAKCTENDVQESHQGDR